MFYILQRVHFFYPSLFSLLYPSLDPRTASKNIHAVVHMWLELCRCICKNTLLLLQDLTSEAKNCYHCISILQKKMFVRWANISDFYKITIDTIIHWDQRPLKLEWLIMPSILGISIEQMIIVSKIKHRSSNIFWTLTLLTF